ncbi:MAG: CoA-transferase [Anaerolineae bacterium]
MTDSKVASLADAVRRFIHNGAHISFGGFTVNRQPMACAYEIIRQGITGLHMYMHSGGQALYGNLNSTCLGDYARPTVRFPGSGGACDVGSFVGRTIVFIRHGRRFVEQLDYLTTPGYLAGPSGRNGRAISTAARPV